MPPRTKPLVRASGPARGEIRPKRCKACRGEFFPASAWQTHCRAEACAVAAGVEETKRRERREAKKARADRVADKAKREELGGRPYWLKRAEKAVNRYVRARDRFKGCISCDKPASWDGQWHASHFRSVAAASSVRYHLWNIQKACWICNKHHSGNIGEYGPRLVALIGQERVDWLKSQNGRADYPIPYLQRLTSVMNRKALRQEKRNALQG